jgi:polyphosphate glucokinase
MMNDADAAGVAEMNFGAGKDREGVVVMITLGTGIGCALFHDGVLIPNTELGHIEIDCKDAERLASGSARDDEKLSWKEYGKRVQKYLRRLDALIWPDLVILGGGVSKEAEKFLADVKVRVPVVTAELLNNAGIVGAAVLAARR